MPGRPLTEVRLGALRPTQVGGAPVIMAKRGMGAAPGAAFVHDRFDKVRGLR